MSTFISYTKTVIYLNTYFVIILINNITIDRFMYYIPPGDIDAISEIKILTTTEININDIK